jgi:hypothetical protein
MCTEYPQCGPLALLHDRRRLAEGRWDGRSGRRARADADAVAVAAAAAAAAATGGFNGGGLPFDDDSHRRSIVYSVLRTGVGGYVWCQWVKWRIAGIWEASPLSASRLFDFFVHPLQLLLSPLNSSPTLSTSPLADYLLPTFAPRALQAQSSAFYSAASW